MNRDEALQHLVEHLGDWNLLVIGPLVIGAEGVQFCYHPNGELTGWPSTSDWRINRDEWLEARMSIPTRVNPGTTAAPTLETMLAEWRDLEARAQAAQAEADALFEHAGQCHGEIVVRLAELGWGAPRGRIEPVVTLDTPLDMSDWRNWQVGDIVESLIAEQDVIVCGRYPITLTSSDDDGRCFEVRDGAGEIWPMHAEQLKWVSRPSAQQ